MPIRYQSDTIRSAWRPRFCGWHVTTQWSDLRDTEKARHPCRFIQICLHKYKCKIKYINNKITRLHHWIRSKSLTNQRGHQRLLLYWQYDNRYRGSKSDENAEVPASSAGSIKSSVNTGWWIWSFEAYRVPLYWKRRLAAENGNE